MLLTKPIKSNATNSYEFSFCIISIFCLDKYTLKCFFLHSLCIALPQYSILNTLNTLCQLDRLLQKKKKRKSMEGQSIRLVFPSLQWILLAAFETAQPLQLQNYPSPKTLKSASSKPQQQNIRGLVSSLATARAALNHISLQFTFIRSGLDTGASTRQRHRTVPHGKVSNYLF